MDRYICIHGHFYQPPRENPWLETIEVQDSAYPYHDWNERVTAECYAPNTKSRILDAEGRIVRIVNNYSRISFDFGPTLLSWLAVHRPAVYEAILAADVESRKLFSGHGSAIAQAYNHMILPLAKHRDKHTQVFWGIRDFEHRFGRRPEGMWLPETAVDLETLEVLVELGILYTILSPYQAARVRSIGAHDWNDISGGKIDPTTSYRIELPSGRNISVFFYDGPISRAVAFEKLLVDAGSFAHRLTSAFSRESRHAQLVHIATDGESYGHHTWKGDMGLAYSLQLIESGQLARLTNYGEYLERHPPQHEVEIYEKTSWSCAHGVERWRSDCGCNSGAHPGWNQAWRAPLREAFDWLRDSLAAAYEKHAGKYLKDPWAARNDYIDVVLDHSDTNLSPFLARHAIGRLEEPELVETLKLLELQRHAMLMYTSCGWFFDELSGIETVQVIQYAGRALQLAEEIFGTGREAHLLERLQKAKSNVPDHQDGRRMYAKLVRPAMVDLRKVGAHYGISSLFENYGERSPIYCYTVERADYQRLEIRRAQLAIGRAKFTSEITRESETLAFGALFFGDYNLKGGVRVFRGEKAYSSTAGQLAQAFSMADFPEVIRLLEKHFGRSPYSLRSLFRDEQRKVLNQMLASSLERAEAHYRQIYERRIPLLRFLGDLEMPLPRAFQAAAEFTINSDLRRIFETDTQDPKRVRNLLEEARRVRISLDTTTLEYTLRMTIERMMAQLEADPDNLTLLQKVQACIGLGSLVPFDIELWTVQNIYYDMLHRISPGFQTRANQGDASARAWIDRFVALGSQLGMRIAAFAAQAS